MHFFINYNQLASEWCKFYWQLSTKKWVKKDFEKYRISYVLIVDFADPEIILAGECSYRNDEKITFSQSWGVQFGNVVKGLMK